MSEKKKTDPRITKRRVDMYIYETRVDEAGEPMILTHKATDYVLPEVLEAYVADAKTRWQHVTVSDEPDAGPGGYDGDTHHPEHLRLGRSLQGHLHDTGVKPITDPTNNPNVAMGELR